MTFDFAPLDKTRDSQDEKVLRTTALPPSSGGDEDAGGAAGARFGANDDLDVAAEGVQEMHQALDGETLEAIVRKRGYLRLVDGEPAGGRGLGKTEAGKNLVDGDGQAGFGVLFFGVQDSEIGEDVAGTRNDFDFISSRWHNERRSRARPPGAALIRIS